MQDWAIRQRQRLRDLRRACLPVTLFLIAAAAVGLAAMALLPVPRPLGLTISAAMALLPLIVAFLWLVHIPEIWSIPGSWVATATFLTSLPLVLFGRYFAADVLNVTFLEAPALFPVASTVAGYFGTLLAALVVVGMVALASLLATVSWLLLAGIMGWIGGRRFVLSLGLYAIATLLVGWVIGSVAHLERLTRDLVAWTAIQADFHQDHRCDMTGWPDGITRVAFIGDEQVLGHRAPGDTILALSCNRTGILGDPG